MGSSLVVVQAATDEDQHSKLADGGYLTALAALEQWTADGRRPDPAGFQSACLALAPRSECRFATP